MSSSTEHPQMYFVKIRGRVLGPIVLERLQEMAAQGQLSRVHTISTDGQNWERASAHPGLNFEIQNRRATSKAEPTVLEQKLGFQTPVVDPQSQVPYVIAEQSIDESTNNERAIPEPSPPPTKSNDENWFFRFGNESKGPFRLQQVKTYIKFKEIDSESLILQPGFDKWIAAAEVTELRDEFSESQSRTSSNQRGGPDSQLATQPIPIREDSQPYQLAPATQRIGPHLSGSANVFYAHSIIKRCVPWLYACCFGMAILTVSTFVTLLLKALSLELDTFQDGLALGKILFLWLSFVWMTIALTYHLTFAKAYAEWKEPDDLNSAFFWLRSFWIGFTAMTFAAIIILAGTLFESSVESSESNPEIPATKIVAPTING